MRGHKNLPNDARMKLKNRCGYGLLPKFGVIFQLSLQFFGAHCTRADDPVLAWDELMLQAIRTESTGPTLSSRNLAILHGAIYDAVNSIDQTHQPFRTQIQAKPGASTAGTRRPRGAA